MFSRLVLVTEGIWLVLWNFMIGVRGGFSPPLFKIKWCFEELPWGTAESRVAERRFWSCQTRTRLSKWARVSVPISRAVGLQGPSARPVLSDPTALPDLSHFAIRIFTCWFPFTSSVSFLQSTVPLPDRLKRLSSSSSSKFPWSRKWPLTPVFPPG